MNVRYLVLLLVPTVLYAQTQIGGPTIIQGGSPGPQGPQGTPGVGAPLNGTPGQVITIGGTGSVPTLIGNTVLPMANTQKLPALLNDLCVTALNGYGLVYNGTNWACGPYSAFLTLAGDVTGSGTSNTVVKVNGGSIPTSKAIVGTNSSGQLVDASSATLTNNTSGNAATATNATNATLATNATTAATATHALNLPADFATQSNSTPATGTFTTVVAGNTYLSGWTSPAAYGASTSNTATQNQTAFLAMATAINAGTTSPHIFLAGDGTYNVLSTGGTALGTYNVPIDFECASWNTTINLSGTGKLIQMGASGWNGYPGGTSPIAWQLNRFHGCQLTGGASASDGIYIATGNTGAWVEHNYFYNFMGASSSGSPSGQKVESIDSYGVTETHIENNQYMRTDGVFGNFAWAHGSTYYYSLFANNNRMICSVSTINGNSVECGAGIESNGILYAFGNECSGPNPCFNVGTELGSSGTSIISGSLLEAVNGCEVDYGTPGGLSTETVNNLVVTNNQVGLFGTGLGFVCARNAFVKLANSDISHNHRRNDATSTLPAVFMNNLTGQTGNQGIGNTGFPSLHSTGSNISAWNANGITFGTGLTVTDTGNGPSVSAPVGASFVTAPNPVFSPGGGTYGSAQTVTITCAKGSPYYSTDGSTVTAYTTGISISTLTTLQGSCQGSGYFPSGTSATYNFGTLASDSFAGTTLSANWTGSSGTFAIASGNFHGATSGLDVAYYNAVSWPNDQFSQVTIGSGASGNDVGAVVRWQSGAASGYAVDATAANIYLRKYTAGSSVILAGPVSHTLAASDVLKLDVQGTSLTVYLNGSAVAGLTSITDSTYSSGNAGIFYFLTGGATPTAGVWSGGTP